MEASSGAQATVAAQNSFLEKFDLNDPVAAMTSYAQQMRQLTQRQMEMTTKSHRRTPAKGVDAMGSLSAESSVDSTSSFDSVTSQS